MDIVIYCIMAVVVILSIAFYLSRKEDEAKPTSVAPHVSPAAMPESEPTPTGFTITMRGPGRYVQTEEDVEFERVVRNAAGRPIEKIIYTKIAGTKHRNDDGSSRTEAIAACTMYTPIHLEPQPDNPYDPNAIVVSRNGRQLGFLEARLAAEVISLTAQTGPRHLAVFRRPTQRETAGEVVGAVIALVRFFPADATAAESEIVEAQQAHKEARPPNWEDARLRFASSGISKLVVAASELEKSNLVLAAQLYHEAMERLIRYEMTDSEYQMLDRHPGWKESGNDYLLDRLTLGLFRLERFKDLIVVVEAYYDRFPADASGTVFERITKRAARAEKRLNGRQRSSDGGIRAED